MPLTFSVVSQKGTQPAKPPGPGWSPRALASQSLSFPFTPAPQRGEFVQEDTEVEVLELREGPCPSILHKQDHPMALGSD